MAGGNSGYTPPTRAELQAMREVKSQAVQSEADRREKSFLRNVTAAGDDLEWILLNQAWTELGYERVGDWWERRVLPVLTKLDLRPSVKLAEQVMAAIEADEAALPKTQRRTTREIATLARTSQAKVSRSLSKARESGSDLDDGPKSPLVEAMTQAIEDAQTAAADAPEDAADGGEGALTAPEDPPASGPSASPSVDGLDVTPVHFAGVGCDGATDAANQDVLTWTDDRGEVTCPDCRRNASIPDPPAAASSHTDQVALVAEQPGPDSSSDSETDEAPAGIEGSSIEEGPAGATSRPGIDHPLPQVGEARADASPLGAGVTPLPELGEGTGGDEVEGEAGPSSSTDLGSDFMADWRRHAGWLLGLNAEAAREWLTPFEIEEIKKDLETLIWLVGELDAP